MKNVQNLSHHRRRNRKGVVDAQFNWIFILITGIVIFMFIIGIVMSQKRNADKQASISAIKQISTILKGRQQSADVYSEIKFPSTNINFRCEADSKLFSFKIEDSNRVDLPLEIIFAPQDIYTNKMLVWGQKFSTGFPVSTFTYITTPDSIIILYNATDGAGEISPNIHKIYADLPSNITKKVDTNIAAYQNYKRIRIVCFEDYGCPPIDKSYLKVYPGANPLEYGNITFHKAGDSSELDKKNTQAYITKAGLYGAIFSDTPNYYECQMSRAMSQLEVKRSLVEARLELIYEVLEDDVCKDLTLVTLNDQIVQMANLQLSWDTATKINFNIINLNTRNEDLRLKSCPKIY